MQIDSFRFLPRSFRPLYENPVPAPGEDAPVWSPFPVRLADARIALLTSAGLHLRAGQPSFDLERERREPSWGDPDWRLIPASARTGDMSVAHLHINPADILADHNVALPSDVLAGLVTEGVVGGAAEQHISVMGYQERGLDGWRERTGPAIVEALRDQRIDGLVLAPA